MNLKGVEIPCWKIKKYNGLMLVISAVIKIIVVNKYVLK